MLTTTDFINIFLPVLSHWIIWLIFLIIVIIVSLLYAYSYFKRSVSEFRISHIGIPVTNIISLYIFTKLLEGVIYQGAILKIDAWINKIVYLPWITKVASFITSFGTGILITILLVITIGVLLFRKRWRFALISLIAIGGATLLQVVIKALTHRVRPENLIETGFSFPSGHAITAIVYVSLLIYSYKDDIKHLTTRYILIILASAFFITVGISRIILHVHWFSDVMAGMSLGLFWFMSLVLIERSITGLIQSVRKESKGAGHIKTAEIVEVAKKIVPDVMKK